MASASTVVDIELHGVEIIVTITGGATFTYDDCDDSWVDTIVRDDTGETLDFNSLPEVVKDTLLDYIQDAAWDNRDEDEEEFYPEYGYTDDDYLIDGVGFADPGGRSALRAATPSNPRNLPCPTCGLPDRLTPLDKARGYQCDDCADRAERGGW